MYRKSQALNNSANGGVVKDLHCCLSVCDVLERTYFKAVINELINFSECIMRTPK